MFAYVESSPPMARGTIVNPYSIEEISKRLTLLRKALGNTQETMGRLAGVSGNAWGNYEKGLRRIELDNVFQLETAIGVPQEWVYRGIMARMPLDLAQKIGLAEREMEREARKRR